jgi:maltooligosyltrehalose trehalohydrolase
MYLENRCCRFCVWAPRAKRVEVHIFVPDQCVIEMRPQERGYHEVVVDGLPLNSRYMYCLDGRLKRPDPASRFQPDGVHGPSQVVASNLEWKDGSWRGLPLEKCIFYELHVGAFTAEGTFEAIVPRLDALRELGVTAIELMPVAQFPGTHNWGYDGVYPFAVQNSYGGPLGLKKLVDGAHQHGMCVALDVVYNHLGPEGNYLADFGPYFTDRYRTPWGEALNLDGAQSDEVRRFFIENALYWITEFHIDTLRLDAIHAIVDSSARPFLEELGSVVREQAEHLNREVHVIAESDRNDARVIRTREKGGYGLDAQWNDDFHHALHSLLTGETSGYYRDFGALDHMARAFTDGFVYSGQFSGYRQRRQGSPSRDLPAHRFVVFDQNHDQVGNRMLGERLSALVCFERLKLAAGVVLLSPFIPLLFMGEEFGETAPFHYFVSHSDLALIEAVRRGRREEFAAFKWSGEIADPQDDTTFRLSKLNWSLSSQGQHRVLRELYMELIRLRRELPALSRLSKETLEVLTFEEEKTLFIRRWSNEDQAVAIFNFGGKIASVSLAMSAGVWQKRLDSAEKRWCGSGSEVSTRLVTEAKTALSLAPHSFALFSRESEALP